jgi:hypothetical protein
LGQGCRNLKTKITFLIKETKIINDNIQNDNNFYIGGNGTNNNFYYGKLDEIRIYSKPLNEDQIQGLGDNSFENGYAYQTDQIGNIFYDVGIISISDPRPKYKNLLLGKYGRFDNESLEYGVSFLKYLFS